MAGHAKIQAGAQLIPRHYVMQVTASLDGFAMIELAQTLNELDVDDEAAGGFFAALREAVAEAYNGDLPQPIAVPDALPDEDGGAGVGATS